MKIYESFLLRRFIVHINTRPTRPSSVLSPDGPTFDLCVKVLRRVGPIRVSS